MLVGEILGQNSYRCVYFVSSHQMDPKLRPSFVEIAKQLEEIWSRLKNEEAENERRANNPDITETKPLLKGAFYASLKIPHLELTMYKSTPPPSNT